TTMRTSANKEDKERELNVLDNHHADVNEELSSTNTKNDGKTNPPWAEAHRIAVQNDQRTYVDPETSNIVMTELFHKERGYCCGNNCRHCPYDHINVDSKESDKKNNCGLFENLKRIIKKPFKKSKRKSQNEKSVLLSSNNDRSISDTHSVTLDNNTDEKSYYELSDIEDVALKTIDDISGELREISLEIHDRPELSNKEKHAHDLIVKYMREKGFTVTSNAYGLDTAFVAEFRSESGKGRVVSFNSEYDALPGIGHGCGHNLIAIGGIGAAIGLKTVLERFDIEGTVKLYGTPAEESGSGKVDLIKAGAYEDGAFIRFLAIQNVTVEYFGKTAHASGAPWEGINALDAIVLAYNNIGLLRQQMLPTNRIHGIITNGGKAPNIIPDYTSGLFYIRGRTIEDLRALRPRVEKCFEAASEATGAKLKIKWGREVYDVKVNNPIAKRYEKYLSTKFDVEFPSKEEQLLISTGSTDQGNVTYVVPGFHPFYNIHPPPGESNHTPGFTKQARTELAHIETLKATKGITLVGLDILVDDEFARKVKKSFESSLT
ncbi:2626_t:CDS:10, partial [Acaulospora morrowiae]